MSQEELSEASGVSRPVISKLESDDVVCSVSTKSLVRLAEALGTTVDAIFFDDGVRNYEQGENDGQE